MKQAGAHAQEIDTLRQRMSMLCGAIQRINEDLNFTNVLQEVVDNAVELTDARYGAIIALNESGLPEDYHFSSGTSVEDQQRLMTAPGNVQLFGHLRSLPGPLRGHDLHAHATALGLPDFHPLPVAAFLSAPIRHQGESVGNTAVPGNQSRISCAHYRRKQDASQVGEPERYCLSLLSLQGRTRLL